MGAFCEKIASEEVQQYISEHQSMNVHQLLLKTSPFPEVSIQDLAWQIKGRQLAEKKFPFLLTAQAGVVFPPHLNLEQSSSEATARYKAQLLSGRSFADLTAGFGIDAFFISTNFEEVTLVEKNAELLEITQHNWKVLGKKASFLPTDLEGVLQYPIQRYDALYLDPARRSMDKKKVFLLEDLSPNVLEIQERLWAVSDNILIKLSPLIDISYLISVLPRLSEIHLVAVKNEVKELLVLMKKASVPENGVKIKCVNLETPEPDFEFIWGEAPPPVAYAPPLEYLYIPNNAVLKSGAFALIAQRYHLKKLHPNTQLYTSNEKVENFVGRCLSIKEIQAKDIKKGEKFNIISKNHPLTPEQIKKKYKITDGGGRYLIFTQTLGGKVILQSI